MSSSSHFSFGMQTNPILMLKKILFWPFFLLFFTSFVSWNYINCLPRYCNMIHLFGAVSHIHSASDEKKTFHSMTDTKWSRLPADYLLCENPHKKTQYKWKSHRKMSTIVPSLQSNSNHIHFIRCQTKWTSVFCMRLSMIQRFYFYLSMTVLLT